MEKPLMFSPIPEFEFKIDDYDDDDDPDDDGDVDCYVLSSQRRQSYEERFPHPEKVSMVVSLTNSFRKKSNEVKSSIGKC